MPGRPPSELASLSLLLQFRVLQDWEVGAVIGRGLTVQQGVSHPLLGARAGLVHFCLQVGSELLEWDLRAGVEWGWGGSPSSSAAPVSWAQCLHPRSRYHQEESIKVPQRQVWSSQCPGQLWPFSSGAGHLP